MILLDGKKLRDTRLSELSRRVRALGCIPTLVIIQIGDTKESNVYIKQKKTFAETIGASVLHICFPEDVSFEEVARSIGEYNRRDDIHGIIVQLPIPKHLDKDALIETIDPKKDIDGLTDENQNLLAQGTPRFIPATAKAVFSLLDFYHIDVKGKKVAVLGRSRLVGSPVAKLLTLKGAHVTVCHSQTLHTEEITKKSDIVVVAIGKPKFVGAEYIQSGVVVVDVGINSVSGKKLVGDVDHMAVEGLVSAMSPVPGGVGPVTVFSLFDTLIESAEQTCRSLLV